MIDASCPVFTFKEREQSQISLFKQQIPTKRLINKFIYSFNFNYGNSAKMIVSISYITDKSASAWNTVVAFYS